MSREDRGHPFSHLSHLLCSFLPIEQEPTSSNHAQLVLTTHHSALQLEELLFSVGSLMKRIDRADGVVRDPEGLCGEDEADEGL